MPILNLTDRQGIVILTALEDYEDYLVNRNTEQDYDADELEELRRTCAECIRLVNEA